MSENKILIINFGSTSSKLSVYCNLNEMFSKSISHSREEIDSFEKVADQMKFREQHVRIFLEENGLSISDLSAIIGRCSAFTNLYGAFEMNTLLESRIMDKTHVRHASMLSCPVAYRLGRESGIPAIFYSFNKNELEPECRITGFPEIERTFLGHPENWDAVAEKTACAMKQDLKSVNIIVAHMGGGVSLCLYKNGVRADIIADNELHFSPERTGGTMIRDLADLIYSNKYTQKEMHRMMMGTGGMYAHLGTSDGRVAEALIQQGDKKAETVYKAMALQISKSIGALAATAEGKIDAIALSGGLSHSEMFTGEIRRRVGFIAPIHIFPGEFEMEAYAMAMDRIFAGKEALQEYTEEIDRYSKTVEDL